jgi:heme/copper-type cytochrome/quinol oxidase subunit 2
MVPDVKGAKGRAVALVVLLLLAGIALRGYLPGDQKTDNQPADNTAAMVAVVTLLGVAVVIVMIAIVATLRRPQASAPTVQHLPRRRSGERWRPPWRFVLIALGVLLGWLLVVVLLMQLNLGLDTPMQQSRPSTPAPGTTTTPAPPPVPPAPTQDESDLFWYLFATTVFMMVLVVAGMIVNVRRHRRPRPPRPVAEDVDEPDREEAAPPPLAVAAERGLAEMGDLSREPREAIIACYAAMEDALAGAPGAVPQESDTPTEVLARAVEHHAIHPGTATDLVELFAEARFSPHVMNEGHRETAVRALQLVLAELRSAA